VVALVVEQEHHNTLVVVEVPVVLEKLKMHQ
jgi:hypothetical protein